MKIHELLTRYWGHSGFRAVQEEVICSVLEKKDTLALMPTGGGKSICFQVPALAEEGICIVISPLIALMKDQVEGLKGKGIKACSITAGMAKREIDIAFDNCIYGNYKFLYLSPERLQTPLARARIGSMNVNLIAVDEAHCISQWGYDFRPSYLNIADLRDLHPQVPVLALTASATPAVQQDIQTQLRFRKEHVIRQSFERKNLSYLVLKEENRLRKLNEIIQKVPGCGIVYVKSRRETAEVAAFLKKKQVSAEFYHAGLSADERNKAQDRWKQNKSRVIVATNAFGMGIDKPDVRFVVHMDVPESLEAYFQEAGRAGRDQKPAYAVVFYNESARLELEKRFMTSYPDTGTVKNVYQALGNYFQLATGAGEGLSLDFDLSEFCRRYKFPAMQVYHSLKFLEKAGYVSFSEEVFLPSRICFLMGAEDLYAYQVANPSTDLLIKTILRSYAGAFDQYTRISESELAKRLRMRKDELVQALARLDREGVLSYLSQKDQPQITYLLPREDAGRLNIDPHYIQGRKNDYQARISAVISYVSTSGTCRSKLLRAYFGEENAGPCGICDVCRELSKIEISAEDIESVRKHVSAVSSGEIINLHRLMENLTGMTEQKKLRIIRFMVDSGELKLDTTSS